MPRYDVTDPSTGRQLTLEGDSEPTESELEDIFKAHNEAPAPQPFDLNPIPEIGNIPGTGIPKTFQQFGDVAPQDQPAGVGQFLSDVGEPFKAIPADVASMVSNRRFEIPNLSAVVQGKDLPLDAQLRDAALESKQRGESQAPAVLGNIAAGIAGSAPLLIAGAGLPALAQRAAALGFSADMLYNFKKDYSELNTELAKPESEQDPDKVAKLNASLISSGVFGPLAAGHGINAPRIALTKGDALRISTKDLAGQLNGPVNLGTPEAPTAQRQLGIRVPENPFFNPGVPELADAALREAGNKIIVPGQEGVAREALRRAIEPPQVQPVTIATAERPGGGEATGGKTSFNREAEAPTAERTQEQLQKEKEAQNALVTEAAQPVQPLRDTPGEIQSEVPAEINRPPVDEGGDKTNVSPETPQVTPEVQDFIDKFNSGEKLTTHNAVERGLQAKTVADLEALAEARRTRIKEQQRIVERLKAATDDEERNALFNESIKLNPQLPREAIEAATNVGGHIEGEGSIPTKYGSRPLDWRNNPEVADWLRSNAADLKITLPDELKSKEVDKTLSGEAKSPAVPAEATLEEPPQKSPKTGTAAESAKTTPPSPGGFESKELKSAKEKLKEVPSAPASLSQKLAQAVIRRKIPDEAIPKAGKQWDIVQTVPTTILRGTGESTQYHPHLTIRVNGKQIWKGTPNDLEFDKPLQALFGDRLIKFDSERGGNYYALKPEAKSGVLDSAISNIEALQKRIRGTGEKVSMGVPSAILDTALEAARLALKAGKSIAEAVDAAIAHIKRNVKKGDYDETRVRAQLEGEISRNAGNGGAERPVALAASGGGKSAQPVNKPTTVAGLDDIYKIFEPKSKETSSFKQKGINIIESLRTGLSSKFRPLNKLAEDIAKAYGRTSSKDIAGIFEQLKGSQGKGEAQIYRFDKDVSDLVKGDEKDFNAYLFLRRSIDRLQQDAKDIGRAQAGEDVPTLNRRRVADYTINGLTPKLEALEAKLGPDKLAKFQKAAQGYQDYLDDALRLQVESGRMSPEVYDAIKNGNQFYAPFKVMKYLEETSRPEGTSRQIDTVADFTKAMQGITDKDFRLGDMLGAARQNILLSRILADKNVAMRHVAELAAFDTEGRFIKKLPTGHDAPSGYEAVNVFQNGKQERYAVNQDVADAVKSLGGTGGGVLLRFLGAASVPFRAGATALNLPFQVSNLLADVPRQALISKYGLRGFQDLVHYPLDFVHSLYSSIAGDVFGHHNKLFQDFLDSGVAGTTVQEHLTPEALKFQEPSNVSKSAKLAKGVLNVIPDFAAAIEQTSKILGVKRALRFENAQSGAQLARQIPEAITELRRFSGSPDFGRTGKWVEQARLNLLYMFLNARIQGAIADVGRLTGRDGAGTAAATWAKVGAAVGIPTAYLYSLNQQPGYKEDYDKRSQQEKQNYWLIPKDTFITTEDGQKLRDYWRIPKRESSKWFANLTESALDFAHKRDPKAAMDFGNQMLQEISPVNIQGNTAQEKLESTASGLNPLIKAPLELATGRDLYRHRDLMSDQLKKASPEQQYTDRTAEAFKKLAVAMPDVAPEFLRSPIILENLTRNLTAGLVTQFLPRKPVEGRTATENTALLQRFQALPYEDNTAFKEEMTNLERGAADEQLTRHRAAQKLLEDNKGKSINDIAAKAGGDVKLIKHLADLWVAKENGATFQDRQLLALPAKQRAMWVAHQLQGLTPEKKQQAIQEFARKRILTEAVVQELPEAMK